tara:strand:+ start:130 stop:369 length:240 start_codon:yes stop_codon:yes gene_type:complete
MPDENTTTLDESLISLMNNMIKVGMGEVPAGAPPEISNLVELALGRGALWLVRQIKPEQIKVLVKANADAKAEIDWGEK